MTRQSRARFADLRQVLVFYDQPQVVYLEGDRGYKILAVAIEKRRGMDIPFFCCEVSDNLFSAYVEGRVDLNYALRQGRGNRYYFFDWMKHTAGETFALISAGRDDVKDESNYPFPGFFSEAHTHHLDQSVTKNPGRLAFHIDGKWSASDFSKFVARIDEIYSFSMLSDEHTIDGGLSDFLKAQIEPREWAHGGDYTQFYRNLKSAPNRSEALRVERIAYNSPGEIVVRGERDALREVAELVETMRHNTEELMQRYSYLRRVLSQEGLLARHGYTSEPSEGVRILITRYAKDLLDRLGMGSGERLFRACRGDPVVFSKVTLSLVRRVRDAALFYAEGRVSADKFVEPVEHG